MDYEGIKALLDCAKGFCSHAFLSCVDGRRVQRGGQGCRLGGEGARVEGGDRQATAQGCSRGSALMAWAREWAKEGVALDWQKLLPPQGFVVLPRRWVVERTFSWIDQNRRMSKDYERLATSSEAFIYVAMTRLMVRRLARAQ
jgi:hypothetical protein